MLLDEPVSALDPAGRRDMLNLIETLRSQAAVLMSTHILDDVERVCDTIGIIDHGRMVALDNRQALLDRYASPCLQIDFRSDAASVAAWAETLCTVPGVKGATASEAGVQVRLGAVDGTDQRVLDLAVASQMPVESFLHTRPTLEDVFLRIVGQDGEATR